MMEFMIKLTCACGFSDTLQVDMGFISEATTITAQEAVMEAVGQGWDVREEEDGFVCQCPSCAPKGSDTV